MRGENPQLCPFTGLFCPFMVIMHTGPYFLESALLREKKKEFLLITFQKIVYAKEIYLPNSTRGLELHSGTQFLHKFSIKNFHMPYSTSYPTSISDLNHFIRYLTIPVLKFLPRHSMTSSTLEFTCNHLLLQLPTGEKERKKDIQIFEYLMSKKST